MHVKTKTANTFAKMKKEKILVVTRQMFINEHAKPTKIMKSPEISFTGITEIYRLFPFT